MDDFYSIMLSVSFLIIVLHKTIERVLLDLDVIFGSRGGVLRARNQSARFQCGEVSDYLEFTRRTKIMPVPPGFRMLAPVRCSGAGPGPLIHRVGTARRGATHSVRRAD